MQKKKGISLIVLVITIIVMIILAAAVVISLSNSGIINRADTAVNLTNEQQVQDLAALVWADAYMEGLRGTVLVDTVKNNLKEQGVTEDKWYINVTDTGVTVITTLGTLITSAEDYGKTVDYTVTVDGTTYTDWQVYYEDEVSGHVFLISTNNVGNTTLNAGTTVASLTTDELALYEKFRVGTADKFTLIDKDAEGNTMYNCQAVAQLIKNYASFANTTDYGSNVVGAIGGPTLELLAAGWNAKGYTPTLALTIDTWGYKINDATYLSGLTNDGLYLAADHYYWLASPSAILNGDGMLGVTGYLYFHGVDRVNNNLYIYERGVRPVVCLSSDIPATTGATTDFSLVK